MINKFEIILNCKNLNEIFNNPNLDIIEDYEEIVSTLINFEEHLCIEFVRRMIENGYSDLIIDKLNVFSINQNCILAQAIPDYKKSFFTNFEKALKNEFRISELNILYLEKNEVQDENICISGKDLIVDNWKTISEKGDFKVREELMRIMQRTEKGKKNLLKEPEKVILGVGYYSLFLKTILNEHLISKEQLALIIEQNILEILSDSMNFGIDSLISTIEVSKEIVETVTNIDNKTKNQFRKKIGNYFINTFDELFEIIITDERSLIKVLKLIKSFEDAGNKINEKLAEKYCIILEKINKEGIIDFIHLYANINIKKQNFDTETIIKMTFPNLKDENLQYILCKIVDELLVDQKSQIDDMEIYGKGHYSLSIKIGNYILKVGNNRLNHEIPYDERIIQPIIRRKLQGDGYEGLYVEVQNLVDKDWYKGMLDSEIAEELYKIYSEMRRRGHRWTDVRKTNVGRLLKPNLPNFNFNGRKIEPEDKAIGFTSQLEDIDEKKVLPKGELVIIDTDYIFDSDKQYVGSIASMHNEFEKMYLRECAKKGLSKSSDKKENIKKSTKKPENEDNDSQTEITYEDER